MKKLIVKFSYFDIVYLSNEKYREKVEIISMYYEDITTEAIIKECKKSISEGNTRFGGILDIKQLL